MRIRWAISAGGRLLPLLLLLTTTLRGDPGATRTPPQHLVETGLYQDIATKTIAPGLLSYAPQYPLWSDGASKRRWVYLPPRTAIDASVSENWVFPVGTKIWKEFSFGKRAETRLLEKVAPGDWTYAAYAWNDDESDAVLVPMKGARNAVEIAPGVRHDFPGVNDCKACHEGAGRDVVLGFNALQLSPDRDPHAPHAEPFVPGMVDLRILQQQGRLAHLAQRFLQRPPRIEAASPRARAALGYLWANCGNCHNAADPLVSVGMFLKSPLAAGPAARQADLASVIGHVSKYQIPEDTARPSYRIYPGDPTRSTVVYRMGTRNPFRQMPPLATKIVDQEALDLITRWIQDDLDSQTVEQK